MSQDVPEFKDAAASFRSMLRQAWMDGYYRGHIDGVVARAPGVKDGHRLCAAATAGEVTVTEPAVKAPGTVFHTVPVGSFPGEPGYPLPDETPAKQVVPVGDKTPVKPPQSLLSGLTRPPEPDKTPAKVVHEVPGPVPDQGDTGAATGFAAAQSLQARPVKPTRKPRTKDKKHVLCHVCGRAGSRGFRDNPDGTARCVDLDACKTRTYKPKAPRIKPKASINDAPTSDIDVDRIPESIPEKHQPAPARDPIPESKPAPEVTARCTDCPRAWTITDAKLLRNTATMHELKHSHIVDVLLPEAVK
jgi:hypothetical protein